MLLQGHWEAPRFTPSAVGVSGHASVPVALREHLPAVLHGAGWGFQDRRAESGL